MMVQLDCGTPDPALAGHLATCGACRDQWAALTRAEALLRSRSLVDPPPELVDRILQAVAREPAVPWPRWCGRAAWLATGLLVMAAGLAATVSGWHGLVDQARWLPLAAGLGRATLAAAHVLLVVFGDGAWLRLLYASVAGVVAASWFAALIVPRDALRPQGSLGRR